MSYTIKYVCNWCGRDDDERTDADLHAARCAYNPQNKTCRSCSNCDCEIGVRYFDTGKGMRAMCKKWKEIV